MKKLILISTTLLMLGAAACTTVKIAAPPGQQITIASKQAKCRYVKQRKVLYWNGIPLTWNVFNELLQGVQQPVKVLILNTWWDNLVAGNTNKYNSRRGGKSNIEIKTMKVYSCVEPE
ncbi:MAG: hypothetical protein PF689_12235 [Deltaproteobacteria bacterium]|jgi:hypothetical protein|nr:hypothetical protein [Deltaproteobacteria bacterium]